MNSRPLFPLVLLAAMLATAIAAAALTGGICDPAASARVFRTTYAL